MSPRLPAALLAVTIILAAQVAGPAATRAQSTGSSASPTRAASARHIVVSALPHVAARATRPSAAPILRRAAATSLAGPQPVRAATTPGPTSGPRPLVTSLPTLQLGTSFAGLAEHCPGAACVEPPDPWIAVGPDDLVQVTNAGIRISNRAGTLLDNVSLTTFFAEPQGETVDGDARIVWDRLHSRWLATELSANATTGSAYLAVSDTTDPTGGWTVQRFTWQGSLPDYPGLGVSSDKFALSANLFSLSTSAFQGADLIVVDAAPLISAAPNLEFHEFGAESSIFTWRPAVNHTPDEELDLVVETPNGNVPDVGFARLTGTVAGKDIRLSSIIDMTSGASAMPAFTDPLQPFAFRTATNNPIDGRPTDAIWQDGTLWFVATTECTPTGDSAHRNCVRAAGINTATAAPTSAQDITFGAPGQDAFWGGIGVTANEGLVVVWSQASATSASPISNYASYRLPTDPAGQLRTPILVQAGTGTYAGQRWGDYVGVAQDPDDARSVWAANEYSTASGGWATQVVDLSQVEGLSGATYHAVSPVRILDTRIGVGLTGPFLNRVARSFQVSGRGGVPGDATAVTGNLTVTAQTSLGYLLLGPDPVANPTTSTLNFPVGDDRANGVTVALGAGGMLAVTYAAVPGATTQVIFDVTGYFTPDETGATYHALTPTRVLDSRSNTGITGPFVSHVAKTMTIAGASGVATNATAVTGNLTVTAQTSLGFLFVGPVAANNPTTSTLNFPVGDDRANGVTVALSGTGTLSFTYAAPNLSATAQVIFDVTGYFTPDGTGSSFHPLSPTRILDSRVGTGLSGPFLSSDARTFQVTATGGVPAIAPAVTGNLTVTQQTALGYLFIGPNATNAPTSSTLNFPIGDDRANGVTVALAAGGSLSVTYVAVPAATAQVIFDVTGDFTP